MPQDLQTNITEKIQATVDQPAVAMALPPVQWGKEAPPAFFHLPKQQEKRSSEITIDEMRQFLTQMFKPDTDPDTIIQNLYEYVSGQKPLTESQTSNLARKADTLLNFENDRTLSQVFGDEYAGMVTELRHQLVREFECKTQGEKMLIDVIVSGYMRQLTCAQTFHASHGSFLTSDRTNYMAMLSKETERAHRQMMTAYQALANLKQPPLKVQINTKNAFLAHNQQVNNNQTNE